MTFRPSVDVPLKPLPVVDSSVEIPLASPGEGATLNDSAFHEAMPLSSSDQIHNLSEEKKSAFSRSERRIVSLAALGGMLEFYDFIIYGIFSIYFAHQFFPANNEFITILQSYLIFVLGYIARPVGGIIFSHIGDEYGRKKVLIITIVLMGLSSLGIGLLPTYAQIGMIAPCCLLFLRLVQGLALGGELPSTYVYINETIVKSRGLAFGITMAGVNGGLLLGMLINFILNQTLTTQQLIDFGWRLPFIVGGLLCLISYQIRKALQETGVFSKIHAKARIPLMNLFRFHFKSFLIGTAITALMSSLVVATIIFMPTYLQNILKVDRHEVGPMMTLLMVVNVTVIYLTGRLSQRHTPFKLISCLAILCLFCVPISYFFISNSKLLFGLLTLGALQGASAMLVPYILTTLFEPEVRLTGVALSYNMGFTLFGG